MLAAVAQLSSSSAAFTPVAPASRPAVQFRSPVMSAEEPASRRQLFARAGAAALAGSAMVQGASAKAGQFGKVDIFGYAMSSPFQPGGPKSGADATYGYAKTDGPILAADYQADITREKASFDKSVTVIKGQSANIDSKTWWLVRDNLRGQAYTMKANMRALNGVNANKAAADKAYAKFWSEINALDLACQKKELALAQKEYADVLAALDAYIALV